MYFVFWSDGDHGTECLFVGSRGFIDIYNLKKNRGELLSVSGKSADLFSRTFSVLFFVLLLFAYIPL